MSAGYFGERTKDDLHDLFNGLINANHILHHHAVLDGYGHISVRNPDNHAAFFMAHNSAPATVASAKDLVEFKTEDGTPVDPALKIGWSERYIHSEVYKRYSGVNCVVHSHSSDVLPYTVAGVSLKPLIHTAGFLGVLCRFLRPNKGNSVGLNVPVWTPEYSAGEQQDLLVRTTKLGASLSAEFSSYDGVDSAEDSEEPVHTVILMRHHGFVVAAKGIEEGVYEAIYTQEAARIQTRALSISNSGSESSREMHFMNERFVKDSWEIVQHSVKRPWRLWVQEVERSNLYVNEVSKTS